jgi:hypothetical protein
VDGAAAQLVDARAAEAQIRYAACHQQKGLDLFAINHAATALLVKRRFPEQSIVALLLSVQVMELLWVLLNLLGAERTTTEASVESVADIHLAYMPYSHSVVSMLGVAVLVWLTCHVLLKRPRLGIALGIGIASHFFLDFVTHAPDLALAPGLDSPELGLGLYAAMPIGAFILELAYGIVCWWIYQGGKALLAVIVLFNVGNLSLLSPSVPGLEAMLANRPTMIVLVILLQIVVTLFLVGWFSLRPMPRTLTTQARHAA